MQRWYLNHEIYNSLPNSFIIYERIKSEAGKKYLKIIKCFELFSLSDNLRVEQSRMIIYSFKKT